MAQVILSCCGNHIMIDAASVAAMLAQVQFPVAVDIEMLYVLQVLQRNY